MTRPTLSDPILGTLAYWRDWYEWSQWVGRVPFPPTQDVEVVFNEWRYAQVDGAAQLAVARETFQRLVEKEPELRPEMVYELISENLWPGIDPDVEDADLVGLGEQLVLVRVSLYGQPCAGLDYRSPEALFGGKEIHIGRSAAGFLDTLLVNDIPRDGPLLGLVATVQATELFEAVAKEFPGVEVWPDARNQEEGYEYCWLMACEGKNATNLAYLRRRGDSLQLKIKNVAGEPRWLDLSGWWVSELLKHVRPRWTFS